MWDFVPRFGEFLKAMGFFLGFIFSKSLGINLGIYRNCSGKPLSKFLCYCKAIHVFASVFLHFIITKPQNRCLTQEQKAVEWRPRRAAPTFLLQVV